MKEKGKEVIMNIAITVSYDGNVFCGWQTQKNGNSVQSELEHVLQQVFHKPVVVHGSGRTDAGVSAIGQVANFEIETQSVDTYKLQRHLNALLPKSIAVQNVVVVAEDFHARKSAKQKTYGYYFYVSKTRNSFYDKFATQMKEDNLNETTFKNQANRLVGTHDFASFCASGTSVKNKVRTIYETKLENLGHGLYQFVVTGNGFLYHMVRIMVGTLVEIATEKRQMDVLEILQSNNRKNAGKTAPAKGLVLLQVEYKSQKNK